jgi:hypothetical protein
VPQFVKSQPRPANAGRKKGTPNKATVEKRGREAEGSKRTRFPGRPVGSKSRTTLVREAAEAAAQAKFEAEVDAIESEEMPLEFMLRPCGARRCCFEVRFAAAKAAALYCLPQLHFAPPVGER